MSAPIPFQRRTAPLPAVTSRVYYASHFPTPEGRGPNGRKLCCWCGGELPKGPRRWCGRECLDEFFRIAGPALRDAIFERDEGRCQLCGWDLAMLEEVLIAAGAHLRDLWDDHQRPWRAMTELWREAGLRYNEAIFEMDHILPLIDGGLTHPDNLRTLCLPCHRHVTALGARRRAEIRRGQRLEMMRADAQASLPFSVGA